MVTACEKARIPSIGIHDPQLRGTSHLRSAESDLPPIRGPGRPEIPDGRIARRQRQDISLKGIKKTDLCASPCPLRNILTVEVNVYIYVPFHRPRGLRPWEQAYVSDRRAIGGPSGKIRAASFGRRSSVYRAEPEALLMGEFSISGAIGSGDP